MPWVCWREKNFLYPSKLHPWWLSWWRICLQCRRPGFDPQVGKIPWRRAWQLPPVFSPGEFPWTEVPRGLQSMGLQRVRHDWVTKHSTSKVGMLGVELLNSGPALASQIFQWPAVWPWAFYPNLSLSLSFIFLFPEWGHQTHLNEMRAPRGGAQQAQGCSEALPVALSSPHCSWTLFCSWLLPQHRDQALHTVGA